MLVQFSMAEVKKKNCFRGAELEAPLASPPEGYRLAEAEEAPTTCFWLRGMDMSEGTTLRWRRHRLPLSEREALRWLTGRPVLALTPLARPTPSDLADEIYFPDLPATPLEKAVTLLRVAAQIEHALMVQYLYASYSFEKAQPQIAGVAIEEMSHLMTVQNLLRCLGEEAPYLQRQDFEPPTDEDERLFPFDLRLEPLSHVSLAKYIVAESPTLAPPDVDLDVLAHIVDLTTGPTHRPITVSALSTPC
jgi:Ferritin-like